MNHNTAGIHDGCASSAAASHFKRRSHARSLASQFWNPTALRENLINDPTTDKSRAPSQRRTRCREQENMNALGELLTELELFCDSLIRKVCDKPEKACVVDDVVEAKNRTCVPFTTDYMFDSFVDFCEKANSLHQQAKILMYI